MNHNLTNIIDSRQLIAQLDKSNALGSIEALADQINQTWQETRKIIFIPTKKIENVVVAGMGGSGLGAHVIQYLFKDELNVPFSIANSYSLPNYVNESTLVILSSYSGNTEETLKCAQHAKDKNAQIMVITAGGELQKIAKQENYPLYLIDPKFNPSQQPRMAIGNSVFGQIALLEKAGIISLTDEQVSEVINNVIYMIEKNRVEVPTSENFSKLLAFECLERRPIIVSSEFMEGSIHVSTNQFNENAKIFADYKIVPELNHHLMEGLAYPRSNQGSHLFIFVNSALFSRENQKRMGLTKDIVEKNQIDTFSVDLKSESKISQVFESIILLSYTNFYLAMLEGIDPSPIPFVDEFKLKLQK